MVTLKRFQALGGVVLHADENDHTVARRGDAVGVRAKSMSLAKPVQAQLRFDRALGAFLQTLLNFADANRQPSALISVLLDAEAREEMRLARSTSAPSPACHPAGQPIP